MGQVTTESLRAEVTPVTLTVPNFSPHRPATQHMSVIMRIYVCLCTLTVSGADGSRRSSCLGTIRFDAVVTTRRRDDNAVLPYQHKQYDKGSSRPER